MISKIRARLYLRNEQGYTGHVTDTHASRVREQEVVHQNVGHRVHVYPGCTIKPYSDVQSRPVKGRAISPAKLGAGKQIEKSG